MNALQLLAQAEAVEHVVPEDQGDVVTVDEPLTHEERIGQAPGLGLRGVGERAPHCDPSPSSASNCGSCSAWR